jgi:phospholipid/cholesterol/gamma-HCH transport system substrate-binding protein
MTYDSKYKLSPHAMALERANSLVSDRYIELTPLYSAKRDHGQVLRSGATLPLCTTCAPAELDDIYAALDKLSVALGPQGANKNGALSNLLSVSAQNLQGNGKAFGESIANLAAAAKTLADSRGNLFSTVRNLQKFSQALSDSDGQIRQFNVQLAQVASDLASERTDLGAALHDLGVALDQVNSLIKNNAGRFHKSIRGLEAVTGILVKEKASLNETLAVAPIALANIVHAYQPNIGALGTRSNLASLSQFDGGTVCAILAEVISAAGGPLSKVLGPLTGAINDTCTSLLTKGGKNLQDVIKKLLGGLGVKLPGGLTGNARPQLGGLIGAGGGS